MGFTDGARVGARVSLYCCVRINLVNTDGATDIWTDVWDYGRPSKTPSVARLGWSAITMGVKQGDQAGPLYFAINIDMYPSSVPSVMLLIYRVVSE